MWEEELPNPMEVDVAMLQIWTTFSISIIANEREGKMPIEVKLVR